MSAAEHANLQVCFFSEVTAFVDDLIQDVESWPPAGSSAWCDLPDLDPRKLAAVLDAGRHHVLRMEFNQQALAESSRDVSAAEDWRAVANAILRNQKRLSSHVYIPRSVA